MANCVGFAECFHVVSRREYVIIPLAHIAAREMSSLKIDCTICCSLSIIGK